VGQWSQGADNNTIAIKPTITDSGKGRSLSDNHKMVNGFQNTQN